MIWQEINRVALLGTNRTTLSDSAKNALRAYGIDVDDASDTQVLLEAAALLAQFRKVQPNFQKYEGSLPEPLKPNATVYISSSSAQHFKKILNEFPLALLEFSSLAYSYELYLLPELCPLAFEAVRANQLDWNAVACITPPEGWWVIGKNEDWSYLKDRPFRQMERPISKIQAATTFVLDIQQQIVAGQFFTEEYNSYEFIKNIYWFDSNAYQAFIHGWKSSNRISYDWVSRIEKAMNILDFRKEMAEELQKT